MTIAAVYLVTGLLWILLSATLTSVIASGENRYFISAITGSVLVKITAIVLTAMIGMYVSQSKDEGARYLALAQDSRDMIFRMSLPDGRFLYVSPASRDVTGYDPEGCMYDPTLFRQLVLPERRENFDGTWA